MTVLLSAGALVGVGPAAATSTLVATEQQYRAALTELSGDSTGPHTITLAADITLTSDSAPAYNGTQPLTIDGDGHTIDGNGHGPAIAMYTHRDLTLRELTIRNGQTAGVGAAVLAWGGVTTIIESTLADNTSGMAGGAINADGPVTITNSTLTGNSGVGDGGAVRTSGSVTITSSLVTGNQVSGVYSAQGGAVSAEGTVTITDSTVSGNTATATSGGGTGGAVRTGTATITVTGSRLSANTATGSSTSFGGAISSATTGTLLVTDSTVDGNVAMGVDNTGRGGAVDIPSGSVAIRNSTFTGNVAGLYGGAVTAQQIALQHGTVVANRAPDAANLYSNNTLTAAASVIADPRGAGSNCMVINTVSSAGWNWSDDTSCALDEPTDLQVPDGDPVLGALMDNGGPTPSRYPGLGSPLRDVIPTEDCLPLLSADQRGVGRPFPTDGACDVGAVEAAYPPTVELASPADGAIHPRGAVVTAGYACAGAAGGAGLVSCTAAPPVGNGDAVDTASAGPHQFAVTATERSGDTATVTHTYTVALARPDGRIQRGTSPLRGNDIYNTLATQTVTGSARPGATVTYYASIQNDAPFPDTLRIRGQGSTTRFTVTYRNPAGTNITTAVRNGTYTTPTLAPGATHKIKITVTIRRSAPTGATLTRTLTTYSVTHPTRTDTVRTTTRRT